MIYSNQRQFAALSAGFDNVLARLGTGIKAKLKNDTIARLLGFKNYNTYLAIGRLASEFDNGDMEHCSHVSFVFDGGWSAGTLADVEGWNSWRVCAENVPAEDVEATFISVLSGKTVEAKELEVSTDLGMAALEKQFDSVALGNIASDIAKQRLIGTQTGRNGRQVKWWVESPFLEAAVQGARAFDIFEIALLAKNLEELLQGQIGNKLSECMSILLAELKPELALIELALEVRNATGFSFSMGESAVVLLSRHNTLQKAFVARHHRITEDKQFGCSESWHRNSYGFLVKLDGHCPFYSSASKTRFPHHTIEDFVEALDEHGPWIARPVPQDGSFIGPMNYRFPSLKAAQRFIEGQWAVGHASGLELDDWDFESNDGIRAQFNVGDDEITIISGANEQVTTASTEVAL